MPRVRSRSTMKRYAHSHSFAPKDQPWPLQRAPRPDGFHSLATVYQALELYDLVTVTAHPSATTTLRLTSNDSRVPTDERNTAWKMVVLALEALNLTAEVEIHIEKRLPVQGGLGAGSANAVAALVGLETELGISSSVENSHPSRKNKNAARVGHPLACRTKRSPAQAELERGFCL